MPPLIMPSGDPPTDRLFGYAERMLADGDATGAADLLSQVIDRVPDWAPAWSALASAEERRGCIGAAAAAYARLHALDPDGVFGAGLNLARLGLHGGADEMPPAYVAALFDGYAGTFERHLVGTLLYRGPALIVQELAAAFGDRTYGPALDLGCGTGLMAAAIHRRVATIDGVDLSAAMVEQARRTSLYQNLQVAEMARFLSDAHASYDLVLAADTFVYVGSLDRPFAAVSRVLRTGGVLAFTVQASPAADVHLGSDLRFAHSAGHIRAALEAAGLGLMRLTDASTRRERGEPVPGLVVVARKH